ncbi:zinc-dependent alcohol dehydrogenase [Meiothermus granaticius]|uniref:Sorbitol dehydrogenase n=1 Tax=Meiothermus granaticius NBRC 107808 TaxID=1227551 RepID=A0A399F471_9DEIN|nr:alcohol dehydrogenase catalytic domain-containing protein [Meiothermus granaticius]RIH91494.1 Sorbitol dehydrogenase [Meiothermus granaticius NBRC 107808]GEM88270.1 sorbitol dehydrogenase [Meiothermus granaticius NBRC 107808]
MKALLIDGPGRLRLGEFEDPTPREGRLRLRVQAVTVCGSDLHYYKEGGIGSAVVREPFVMGHEFSARIDDDEGERYGLPRGTLVAVDPAEFCGHCEWCRSGHPNLCPNVRFAGSPPVPGALREFFWAKPETLFTLPAGFDAVDAALLEPLGIAIHGVDLAKIRLGASVGVVGAGAIGLYLMQVARVAGAGEIHVLEPLEYRRRKALELGADAVHATPEALLEATQGRGVDVVLEATDQPQGPEDACTVARIGGKVILVGIPDGDRFTLTASQVRRKGLTLKLSRRMGHVYPRAIWLAASGKVNLKAVATHSFPLEQAPQAFALQLQRSDGVIKSVIHMDPASR